MYGLIHVCLQHMVKTKFGEEKWGQLLSVAGLDNKTFLTFRCYPDEETLKLLDSAAQVLHASLDDVLEMFGDHFLAYVMENGYEDMLRGLGSSFLDFIQNINYLHWYLMSTAYPGIVSPSFVCSRGLSDEEPPILDYYSNRTGMHPLAIGLLRAIGRDLFQKNVEFEFLEANEEKLSSTMTLYHRKFRVNIRSIPNKKETSAVPEKPKFGRPKEKGNNDWTPDGKDSIKRKTRGRGASGPPSTGHITTPRGIGITRPEGPTPQQTGAATSYGGARRRARRANESDTVVDGKTRGVGRGSGSEDSVRGHRVSVPSKLFCKIQPYHIVFDSNDLTIVQAGSRMSQFFPQLRSSPTMDAAFELVWPMVPLTSYNLKRFKDFVFQLAAKPLEVAGADGKVVKRVEKRFPAGKNAKGAADRKAVVSGEAREGNPAITDGKKRIGSTAVGELHLPRVGQPPFCAGARRRVGAQMGTGRGPGRGRPDSEATGKGAKGSGENGNGQLAQARGGEPANSSRSGRKGSATGYELVLKGEIYPMEGEEPTNNEKDSGLMIFVGTPLLQSLSELREKSMRLSDVPLYDSTRELVLLKHQRSTEFDLMTRLEETTLELTSTWEALRVEKQKADSLLYSMIPREVAALLQSGERVQQSFPECTILFSDIVTFTVIASKSTPLQIVDMLNALYTEFDALTEKNDVYKVETIGDAYMVVGGVPRPTPDHAVQVAKQAVGMVQVSGRVLSPVSGLPIQIRVGMHSGPVVAGCVGLKMPRYCLFGDTVNTASRMESHGVPGKVHLSGATKRSLEGSNFKMIKRGDIDIKGKGIMDTYFLVLPNEGN